MPDDHRTAMPQVTAVDEQFGAHSVGGRPSVMDPDKLAAARARLARGESATQVAKALKVSRATLYRHTDVSVARGHAAAE
jgi:DNA invertase Pin-like site-specific DNA recombinase